MSKLISFIAIGILSAAASVARADAPLGLWESTPDASGLVVHVRTKACGRAVCGRVERAKDRRGYDTPSNAVGRQMIRDMIAQPDGSYQGTIWEPASNRMLVAKMHVRGNQLQVQNCDGDVCRDVVWNRLR